MHRFFIKSEDIRDDRVLIYGEDVKHIRDVLRLREKSEIELSDSKGSDYVCEIESIGKDNVCCKILKESESRGEPPIEIVLFQGLPKSTKMELIIQKATELGVRRIVPVITERCVAKISDKKKEQKKIERWQKIAQEAAKQSRRGRVPEVCGVMSLEETLNYLRDEEMVLVPYEEEDTKGIKDVLSDTTSKRVNIVIGPEGGFESFEIDALKDIGAKVVSLGPRILRTETAGFTTITIVLYELGDLGEI